jgi:hypothetical protein
MSPLAPHRPGVHDGRVRAPSAFAIVAHAAVAGAARAVVATVAAVGVAVTFAACAPRAASTPPPATAAKAASPFAVAAADACVVGPRTISAAATHASKPVLASRREQLAVAWEETSESERTLRLQIFDAHGDPAGDSRVLAQLRASGGDARIAATADGYAVVWSVDRDSTSDVLLQRLDARGRALSAPVTAFSAESARPLALTAAGDGFIIAWWQWAADPHREVATWLDARGERVTDVELTRMPPEDPVVDLARDDAGQVRVAFEQQLEGDPRVIVGRLERDRVAREGSEYEGRDPALVRDGTVFTVADSGSVAYASFGAAASTRLAAGRMVDGAILGADSVLCRAQLANDRLDVAHEELSCAREQAGALLRERVLARFPHAIGAAQLADTSFGYAVAVEGEHPDNPDTDAVHVTFVVCND